MQCRASRQQAVARAAPSGGSLRGGSLAPDLVQPPLQTELIEAGYRPRGECRDALMQHAVGVLEGKRDLGVAAGRFRRIGMPQCAVIGWPGHTGQASPAALSQTVKMKSNFGAAGCANTLQDFDRYADVS